MGTGTVLTFDPNAHNTLELRRALQMLRLQVPIASYDWTGTAPTTTDDITKGWKVGSTIITANTVYVCSNNAEGAAVWQTMVGSNITSGGTIAAAGLDGTVDYVVVWDYSTSLNKRVILNDLVLGGGGATDVYKTVTGDSGSAVASGTTDTLNIDGGQGIITTAADGTPDSVEVKTVSQVYITAAAGSGTISNKTYEANTVPANKVLTGFESDNDSITVTIEVHAGTDSWMPASVTLSGGGATPVASNQQDWTQVGSSRIWTTIITLTDAGTTGTLAATMSDGQTTTCTYTRSLDPPLVLTAVIDDHPTNTGGDPECPYAQTQVKQGDTLAISGTAEAHADEVYVIDSDVTLGQGVQGPFTVTAGVWSGTINVGSGTNATSTYTCYAKVTGGTAGANFTATETVDKNQTVPTFTGGAQSDIAYPATQEALKDVETCDITVTHTNAVAGDTYLYDDNSTGELTIPNTTTYAATKTTVTRLSGDYRESGTNYRLTATRTEMNGASATKSVTVKIAHVAPTISVTGATTRLRTDNGTLNYKDHTITLTSSQANLSTYTAAMSPDAGDTSAFTGSWTASGSYSFTNTLRVEDADINAGGTAANNFTWSSISMKNRAGKETTTVTTNPDYDIGGFEARTLTIAAWPNREADMSVLCVDTTKITSENLSKGGDGPNGGTVFTFDNSPGEGSTPDDEVDKFCVSNGSDIVDDDGQYWYNKDQANAISNSSGTAQVIVEETA